VAACFLFLNQLAKITYIREALLIPFLLLLIYLGGFTVKNSFGDMIMVLVFGALGWLMVQFDWQRPPLLLGLVLGTIAERNLFISTRAYGTSWLTHPGVVIIALLILGAIVYSLRQVRQESARLSQMSPEWAAADTQLVIVLKPAYRLIFALLIVAAFAYMLREAFFEIRAMEERAALFPIILGIPGLALAVLALGQELLVGLRGTHPMEVPSSGQQALIRRRVISIIAWTLGFFLAIWLLGFNIAVPVATFFYLKLGGRERWLITILLTFFAWAFFYGLFDYVLHLPFPEGELFLWLR